MTVELPYLIECAGLGQLCVLVASALVPLRLDWIGTFASLPKLHRQMYWTYGGYIVLAIIGNGVISIFNASELASGSLLARSLCAYFAVFWGLRLSLQCFFDVKPYLHRWWLFVGYHLLTLLFAFFTFTYTWAAFVTS